LLPQKFHLCLTEGNKIITQGSPGGEGEGHTKKVKSKKSENLDQARAASFVSGFTQERMAIPLGRGQPVKSN
jgi:hypothetical protein